MPLHMTKIAFRSESVDSLRAWLESHDDRARLTTKYRPTRFAEMEGGSLYWIHQHAIVGRSSILGFEQAPDGRWWINLAPELIGVHPRPKRAHQGWRYLAGEDAPLDFDGDDEGLAALPPNLAIKLAALALI